MKFLKLTTAYPSYLRQFYQARPLLAQKTYTEQKTALDHDAFGLGDFWSHALNGLEYEATELLANNEPLQRAWCAENGVTPPGNSFMLDIAMEQIRRFKPDILFTDAYSTFSYDWMMEVKAQCPSIKMTLGWCGAPYHNGEIFKAFDLVLSCIPELVTHFRDQGHRCEHLNHGFEPRLLERLEPSVDQDIDFSFIGNIVRANAYHQQREAILEGLLDAVPVQIFTPASDFTKRDEALVAVKQLIYSAMQVGISARIPKALLRKMPVIGRAADWPEAPLPQVNQNLMPVMRPPVFGLEMYRTLRRSKATFNSHIDVSSASASNMRLYEATGSGACLVTDDKPNLSELFEPDAEVVTYRSVEECIEKVRWLLEHPAEREAIARKGQARTLKDHTIGQRMARLDQIISATWRR